MRLPGHGVSDEVGRRWWFGDGRGSGNLVVLFVPRQVFQDRRHGLIGNAHIGRGSHCREPSGNQSCQCDNRAASYVGSRWFSVTPHCAVTLQLTR